MEVAASLTFKAPQMLHGLGEGCPEFFQVEFALLA